MNVLLTVLSVIFGWAGVAGIGYLLYMITTMYPDHTVLIALSTISILIIICCAGMKRFYTTEGEGGFYTYENFYDLFRCFLVFAVPAAVLILALKLSSQENINEIMNSARIFSIIFSSALTIYISYTTAKHAPFIAMPFVLLAKFILSFTWVLSIFTILNPGGRNSRERASNRALAALVMMIITPLINYLVLSDDGGHLIRDQFKGRRFSGAKSIRNTLR